MKPKSIWSKNYIIPTTLSPNCAVRPENACQVPGIQQAYNRYSQRFKGLSKGGNKSSLILLSDHPLPDPIPNAAHTSDSHNTCMRHRVKWNPKILDICQCQRLRKGTQPHFIPPLHLLLCCTQLPVRPVMKNSTRHTHSVNSLYNRLNSLISLTRSLTISPVHKHTHAFSRRFWVMLISLRTGSKLSQDWF